MRRVIVWEGLGTQYDVLNHFARGLAAGFRALGWSAKSVCLSDTSVLRETLGAINEWRPDVVVGFNGVGPFVNGVDVIERLGIPQVLWLVDHPAYHLSRIRMRKSAVVGCVDLAHEDYSRRVVGGYPTLFLPHGVNTELVPTNKGDRDLGIVLAGSFIDPERIRREWENRFPPSLSRLVWDIAEAGVTAVLPVDHHVQNTFERVWAGMSHSQMAEMVNAIVPYVDRYVRNRRRQLVALALGGREVHVFGSGDWKLLAGGENFRYHGSVDYPTLASVFQRTRVVVNVLPWFTHGSHERPMLAAYAGALVLSDKSAWMSHEFPEPGMAGFEWPSFEDQTFRARVEDLVGMGEDERSELAHALHEIIGVSHSWEARARVLSESLQWD